jgi:hypothetical protein
VGKPDDKIPLGRPRHRWVDNIKMVLREMGWSGSGYYVLFLLPVCIVQMTKLVQFTKYNAFSKIPPSTSMHFATRVRTWRVARLYSVLYSEIAVSRKPFGIRHMYIYTFLLRMTNTMTFHNIACAWDGIRI